MMNKRVFQLFLILTGLLFTSCGANDVSIQPPAIVPKGILVEQVPEGADIVFVSMRYVLNEPGCLDNRNYVKRDFINDPACNRKIYNPEIDALAAPRQVYSLDLETGRVDQLTNLECDFSSIKLIDDLRMMAIGACSDTDGDGFISAKDEPDIYTLLLAEKDIECLTCDLGLRAINNPDFSQTNQKIVFSAQREDKFHNYLFTLDLNRNLVQITDNEEYMDFDCSWSEDGEMIVFNRLPEPFLSQPSQVWLMDKDGSSLQKMTNGGANPNNEGPHGPYPIGLDADPDLSPDSSQIVFSRLRSGEANQPFGVFDLVILDIPSGKISILDSTYANMVPEWKDGGILFIRQVGSTDSLMDRKQSMYLYTDGSFTNLEPGFDIFPIGSNGASWIE